MAGCILLIFMRAAASFILWCSAFCNSGSTRPSRSSFPSDTFLVGYASPRNQLKMYLPTDSRRRLEYGVQGLEHAGWRFFAEGKLPANIRLEPRVTVETADLDAFGNDFEKTRQASSTSCCSTQRGFRFLFLRPRPRTRFLLLARNRLANTQDPRIADSSSCQTATSNIFGTLAGKPAHHHRISDTGLPSCRMAWTARS